MIPTKPGKVTTKTTTGRAVFDAGSIANYAPMSNKERLLAWEMKRLDEKFDPPRHADVATSESVRKLVRSILTRRAC